MYLSYLILIVEKHQITKALENIDRAMENQNQVSIDLCSGRSREQPGDTLYNAYDISNKIGEKLFSSFAFCSLKPTRYRASTLRIIQSPLSSSENGFLSGTHQSKNPLSLFLLSHQLWPRSCFSDPYILSIQTLIQRYTKIIFCQGEKSSGGMDGRPMD